MRRVLITGANGQLGQAMVSRLAARYDVLGRTRAALDIASASDVAAATDALQPSVIINCAAYNNVDGAQDEPLAALAANAWGPKNLARAATRVGATLVHYSTDFVFDGETDRPYVETDLPRPPANYAASKLLGEWFALEASGAYVLRVESLFGGERARSSVDVLLNAVLSGGEARPFSDRLVSPSYVDDVVDATWRILEQSPAPACITA